MTTIMATTRERGEGSIYQRGGRWWIKYHIRGRAYRESSGSTKKRAAVDLLRQRLAEIAGGRFGPTADRVTFDDLRQMVEDDYALNGRPYDRAARSFAHLQRTFQRVRAIDITRDRLAAYARVRVEQGAALATVARDFAVLRRGFNLAVLAGRLSLQHIPKFPTLHINNIRQGFFDDEDFWRLRDALPVHVRPLVTFMYLTGWRSGEAKGLRWTDVDFDAGVVTLAPGTTKNGEGRTFPMRALPVLRDLLERQRKAVPTDCPWVFPYRGRAIGSFRTAWRSAVRRAGLEGKIPHDFRRTAVRRLERAGVSRSVAMALVGHKTESIYRRYAIVNEQDLAEGVAKVAGAGIEPATSRL